VREAVFDILGAERLRGARVLELYAGTGALGVEALSRGAARADFVEGSRDVAGALRENLARLGLEERAAVHVADLGAPVLPPALRGPWDVVFLDPPYAGDAAARWLAALALVPWPPAGGLVVLERRRGALEAPEGLALLTERRYGDTVVEFYRAEPAGPARRKGSRLGRSAAPSRRGDR
jgi:16S rRNA (guanine966-N2)-methyltransferase